MINNLITIPGYRIIEQIYNGTRTEVYRGLAESNQKPVVIKLLLSEYPTFNELVQFRNQYTIAKNLDLAGIVKPIALLNYRNGLALVMADIGGVSLAQEMNKKAYSLGDFFHIAIQIVQTLEGLAQNRIIHKDIKPQNILINPETREVKLIDFSISSLLPRENQEIKNPNVLEGTLAYMSPEQTGRMNRGIDYRTDFYSLGVTLYELLTGQLPFISNDPMELVHCHIAKNPTPPIELSSAIPMMVNEMVMKLMAKNAEERYQSASGLRYDLENCWQQWQEKSSISQFTLGQRDKSDRFVIPEKLYGREIEVSTLLSAFERVAGERSPQPPLKRVALEEEKAALENSPLVKGGWGGSSQIEMMLVAGFSGIGKTAVINEVHKPIVRQRGYFIKGKFDQFKRDIPFSAWVQAFQNLIRQFLTGSQIEIQTWKAKILSALGESAGVIIEVIPELELLIGKQPEVPELEGMAAQNRFNLLLQKFIRALATEDHPLVIFLDDLQWADSASLKLIQLLMSETDTGYLLLMGAYRDNEVFGAHPLMLTLEEIRKTEATINQITLAPLDEPSLNCLIADTLNCLPERALPLTELVFSKTKGNPFFATQFLKSLHQDELISFDFTYGYWQCDIAKVKALALTDDVVQFMALQLQKFPQNTQEVLKLAACIGNQFDLATLAIVHEKSPAETAADLWKALQEGLVIPITEIYKIFQKDCQENEQLTTDNKQLTVPYKFLHDRVQQAAYSLIPEDQKKATHLKIGQLLLSNTPTEEREEKIFDIVNQLNIGVELITSQIKRDELASLNLIAGHKAKASTAYAAAKKYLTVGLETLAVDSWESNYNLTLALHEEAAEAAYLNGDFDEMEQLVDLVLKQAKILLEKVKVYSIKIQGMVAQGNLKKAINIGLQVSELLGVSIPEEPSQLDIQKALEETESLLKEQEIEDLINLPEMTDPKKLAAIYILTSILAATFIAAPEVFVLISLSEVNLSIKYGNSTESGCSYAVYGLVLRGKLHNIELSYKFGKLALSLVERLNAKKVKAKALLVFGGHLIHWKEHLRENIAVLIEGYQSGLETGDFECAAYSAAYVCECSYLIGQELTGLEQQIAIYSKAINQLKQESPFNWTAIFWQVVLNLLGKAEDPMCLMGDAYNKEKALPLAIKANNRIELLFIYSNELILCYLFGDLQQAVKKATLANQYIEDLAEMPIVSAIYLYESLAYLILWEEADDSEKEALLNRVNANQEKMREWADYAPMNYLHKFHLVEAEKHRVLGEKMEAIEMYEHAIKAAKDNEYINEEALSNELAAKFYLNWGKEKIAQAYLTDAYYAYVRWGAKAKVEDLEEKYPQLLSPILNQKKNLEQGETITQISTVTMTSTSSGKSEFLDLTTVIKASQALSGEINLDKLLSTVMQVAIENAGASKGALVLERRGNLIVEAVGMSGASEIKLLQSVSLENSEDVPKSLINYVARTQEPLIYNNLPKENPNFNDSYLIQHQPQSVLCLPIQHQGKAIAVLYLENNLVTNVFTPDRLAVLKILASQAAISLENAQLYTNLEAKIEERTQELQESQAKFSGIIQIAGNAIISVDETQQICLFNQAAEEIFGYTAQEVIGQPLDILLPTTVRDRHRHHISQFGKDRVLFRSMGKTERSKIQGQRKNGELFPAEASISRLQLRDGLLFTVIINDITERQQAEDAIRHKNQELSDTLQQLKNTQDELIQSEKMAALGQLVAGVAHEINTPLGAIRSSIGYVSDFLAQNLNRLPLFFQKLSPERQQQFLEMLERSQQNSTTVSGRERRQLRKAIASQLQEHGLAESDTLANLLLDLGISNHLEPYISLFQDPECEEFLKTLRQFVRLQESTRDINTASERAAKIVFALKTYARFDKSGETIVANIVEGIEAVLTLYQNQLKQGVKLIRNYQELPVIRCYFDELNQVWTNLVHNSLQAMENRGTLTVETKQDNGSIYVNITDSGQGIPQDIQDKIFQPFFTTKPPGEGSGLGLDIVKKIVEKHQGNITFVSVPGQTTFTVVLPINK
jgi:PAS domain S-box-containing protein